MFETNKEITSMQDEIKNCIVLSDKIRGKYEGKMAEMTGQEETEWTNLLARADMLSVRVEALKKAERIRVWSGESASSALPMAGPQTATAVNEAETKAARRSAWSKYLVHGVHSLLPSEIKAYQADSGVGGGFLISPQEFVQELILKVKDYVFVRQRAKVYTCAHAESLGIPALDTEPSNTDWTAELLTGGAESTLAFGKRELKPHPIAKLIQVSNKLLRSAAMNPEEVIQDRVAYIMGRTQEQAFLNGSGADQPLGVFTPSSQGISTTRDVTAATTTAVAGDDFISVKYKLKQQYHGKAEWIMHRDVVAATRKLKDQNLNYIWTTGLTNVGTGGLPSGLGPGGGLQGTPDYLLGMPVNMSELAPSAFTTGLYLAVLGDFSRYVIADALDLQVQVLDQLYAATNQTGYIFRSETDGMPVLEEAFARLILK